MKTILFFLLGVTFFSCEQSKEIVTAQQISSPTPALAQSKPAKQNAAQTIHVVVALCDNQYQGIVPVPAKIGNGDDPANNLYWGAAFGVKSFFRKANDWSLLSARENPKPGILERLIFKHKTKNIFLVADAYRGREIKQSLTDFFAFAAGTTAEIIAVNINDKPTNIDAGGNAEVIAFVGHDGLMDFNLETLPRQSDEAKRETIMLACISKRYFAEGIKTSGAKPLLWTTGLMAPEAYVLKAAIDGWVAKESDQQIRVRAANAYNQYQHCGAKAALNLFATGW